MSDIEIIEVGPRDGLQNQSATLSTADKLTFIARLIEAGARRIEVASFVNPQRVPQMADAEAVLAGLRKRADVTTIGLVLNAHGLARALRTEVQEIGVVAVASDTFGVRNQKQTALESVDMAQRVIRSAKAAGRRAQATIAVSFGCPFEGEIDARRVIEIAEQCASGEPQEIAIADTIGVGVPTQVTDLLGRLREKLPRMPLRAHFHNTRNTGLANAYAAAIAGVATLDASIGGIGGCPFAPAATGNIATEDLAYMLGRMGVETGVSLDRLIEASRWLEAELGAPMPGMVMKAGNF